MLLSLLCLLSKSASLTQAYIDSKDKITIPNELSESLTIEDCFFYNIKEAISIETTSKPVISIADNIFHKCTAENGNVAAFHVEGKMELTATRNCFNEISSTTGVFDRDRTISIQIGYNAYTDSLDSTVKVDYYTFRDIHCDDHPIYLSPTLYIF